MEMTTSTSCLVQHELVSHGVVDSDGSAEARAMDLDWDSASSSSGFAEERSPRSPNALSNSRTSLCNFVEGDDNDVRYLHSVGSSNSDSNSSSGSSSNNSNNSNGSSRRRSNSSSSNNGGFDAEKSSKSSSVSLTSFCGFIEGDACDDSQSVGRRNNDGNSSNSSSSSSNSRRRSNSSNSSSSNRSNSNGSNNRSNSNGRNSRSNNTSKSLHHRRHHFDNHHHHYQEEDLGQNEHVSRVHHQQHEKQHQPLRHHDQQQQQQQQRHHDHHREQEQQQQQQQKQYHHDDHHHHHHRREQQQQQHHHPHHRHREQQHQHQQQQEYSSHILNHRHQTSHHETDYHRQNHQLHNEENQSKEMHKNSPSDMSANINDLEYCSNNSANSNDDLDIGSSYSGSGDQKQEMMYFHSTKALWDSLAYVTSMTELCDVVFHVGPSRQPVYGVKSLLSVRSRVMFLTILNAQKTVRARSKPSHWRRMSLRHKNRVDVIHDGIVDGKVHVEVSHYDVTVFSQLIGFLHSGRVEVNVRTALGLYSAAIEFEVPDLRKACWDFVQRLVHLGHAHLMMTSGKHYLGRRSLAKLKCQLLVECNTSPKEHSAMSYITDL